MIKFKSLKSQALLFAVLGMIVGIGQKMLDGTAVGNYFGRFAVWILTGVAISVYAETAKRAAVNVGLFFACMLAGYYGYCSLVLGFLPVSYMLVWAAFTIAAVPLGYICHGAKDEGVRGVLISGVILGALFAQAFIMVNGFYMTKAADAVTWLVGVIVLWRKPKQMPLVAVIMICVALLYQLIFPYFG